MAAPLTYRTQPSYENYEEEEMEATHMYSEPAPPVRSVSEHRFEDKNVTLKERANSCPDEKEIYSEVTVCMSQVIKKTTQKLLIFTILVVFLYWQR